MSAALDFLRAARQCEIRGLEQLAVTCGLVGDIGAFVHALQRERGLSNLHLASSEARFAAALAPAVEDGVRCEQALRVAFERLDMDERRTASGVRLFTRIAQVLYGMDGLPALRTRILAREVDAREAGEALTRLIGGLLAVVFEAADTATDPDISRALAALFNFMQGKELAGQERAAGAAGFAAGRFDEAHRQRLAYLIDAQERCFDLFADLARPNERARWQDVGADQSLAGLERLRRIAASGGAGAGAIAADEGERWFELASRRIDAMRDIEQTLADALGTLCRDRIVQTRAALAGHDADPQALATDAPPAAPVAVFLDPASGTSGGMLAAEGLGPQLGRSILDLVQEQSRRLQAMSDELSVVRKALDERKLVERAKGLLMRHQGLGEEQAYRLLRRTAMEQNRRLAEVAGTVLALAGLFEPGAGN